MRAGSTSGREARTSAAARTSQALAANENWTCLTTVLDTPRVLNGSMVQAAMPASVMAAAMVMWCSWSPRLPGATITTGWGPAPSGTNSLAHRSWRGIAPVSEMA